MAHYHKLEVLNIAAHQGMIPLFYHSDVDAGKKLLKACYDGGSRILEFTNRGDFAHEVFAELNKYALDSLPGMILGVGSIAEAGTASLYMQLGANFIVSPSFREDVARTCNRRKVPYMPGCGSLTEIGLAEEMGCDIVKLFPGSAYGPSYVKAVRAPQPWTTIMPTGGVSPDEDNLRGWFNAGVTCVGMGSKLINQSIIDNSAYNELSAKVGATLALIKTIRSK